MELISVNFGLIVSLLAGAVSAVWVYLTSKKNKALSEALKTVQIKLQETQVDSGKIKVATENFEFYQNMLDDAHARYQTLMTQYEKETAKLSKLVEETRKMVDTHEQYIAKQRLYIAELEALLLRNDIKPNDETKQ